MKVSNHCKVTLAKSAGFCYGVQRAVEMTLNELNNKNDNFIIATYGELIHNEDFLKELGELGLETMEELTSVPDEEAKKGTIIIRAHGIGEEEEEHLRKKWNNVVDATCPFVKRIHNIVIDAKKKGYGCIIIGDPKHPEVLGIAGRIDNEAIILENEEDAENIDKFGLNNKNKFIIVAQTTFLYEKFQKIIAIIKKKGYDNIDTYNTICDATTKRQEEAVVLAKKSQAMIVIGGEHSSNTQKLYELCKKYCQNTLLIQNKGDLDTRCLQSIESLGITAGASTPHNIIEEVQEECLNNKHLKKC